MKLDPAAFAHVPQLRDKILHPLKSRFRDLNLDAIDKHAFSVGQGPDWRRSDAEREESRAETLAGRRGADLWVFAYGSLMWDPAFYFREVRLAVAEGYRRHFCLTMKVGRGSLEAPGLMAALDRGGKCSGLVFRIDREQIEQETEIIWRREMITYGYRPVFVPLSTGGGEVEALTFVADMQSDRYQCGLDTDRAARMIACARGFNGTNIEYLDNLAAQLELLGLSDPEFADLHARARALAMG